MNRTIKTLFVHANPMSTSRLAIDEEQRSIEMILRAPGLREPFELIVVPAARPDDLERALLEHDPVILHFSGHGSGVDGLVFQDDSGTSEKLVRADALGRLVRVLRRNVRIVILNACYSEEQAKVIGRDIDFVVGMTRSIDDTSARSFVASFYRGLTFGETIETSFELGKSALEREGRPCDGDAPVLLVRSGASAKTGLLDPR